SVTPTIGVAIPERSGQMQLSQIAQRTETLQIWRIGVHTHPIEHFNLEGAVWQLRDIGDVMRFPNDPQTSTHRQCPFSDIPVWSIHSHSIQNESENKKATHDSVKTNRTAGSSERRQTAKGDFSCTKNRKSTSFPRTRESRFQISHLTGCPLSRA